MKKNFYELTYIVNPVLDEEEYKSVVEKFTKLLTDNDAEVEEVDEWGYYVNAYFDAPAAAIEKIERAMRIDDNVMRYLTLKYDAKMLRHRELQKKNEVPDIFAVQEEED